MALTTPFYLAVGTCILEDGTGTTGYGVSDPSFPAPAPDGAGGHLPATRSFAVRVEGATIAACRTLMNALVREAVRDNYITWQASSTETIRTCRIREASVVESQTVLLQTSRTTSPVIRATVTLVTDPYWIGPATDEVDLSSTVTTVPGHFDVTSVTGEVDALLSMRIVPTRDGRGLYVGVKPEPATGYDYLDDYGTSSDTADANALGGYKKGATVDSTLSVDVAAPTIDTNGNRGRHLLIARMDSSATTATNNTAQARTTTTGNAIAASVDVDEQVVTFSSNTLIGYEMGDVQIPAGRVPDVTTGSGYGAEAVTVSQLTEDADASSKADGDSNALNGGALGQTVALSAGEKVTGVAFKTASASVPTTDAMLRVYAVDGSDLPTGAALASASIGTLTPSTEFRIDLDWTVPASANYAFVISQGNATEFLLRQNSAGGYASGKGIAGDTDTSGWGALNSLTGDLYFKVYTQAPLGFNTSNSILTACSESSKVIALDYVQRIPVDYAAITYRPAASGSLGMFYDADTDTPYIADADGIGPAIYDKCEIRKPLRLKPGVTNRVVLGILQEDAAVAGFTALSYSYRPRYLTATG